MTDCCEPHQHAIRAVMAERRDVEDRYIDTLRAFEAHERTAHPIRAPRRWTPANYDGEPWPSGVVSSTFDPATLEDGAA